MSQFTVGSKPSRHEGDLVRWSYPKWPAGKDLPKKNEEGEVRTKPQNQLPPAKSSHPLLLPPTYNLIRSAQPFNPHKDTYPHLLLVPFGPLPFMPVHLSWLQCMTEAWGFEDLSETLRHVVFVANSEPNNNKRLIFRIKRCLHCHVGARADQHKKVTPDKEAKLYKFQVRTSALKNTTCDIS